MEYAIREKTNHLSSEKKAFYPQLIYGGEISVQELGQMISERCSLNKVAVETTLKALCEVLPGLLAFGNIIDLGDFARVKLYAKTQGKQTKKEVNRNCIKELYPKILLKKQFCDKVKTATKDIALNETQNKNLLQKQRRAYLKEKNQDVKKE